MPSGAGLAAVGCAARPGSGRDWVRGSAHRALDYYGWVLGVSSRLAKTDLPLADQLRRQAQSIVHNTAEGAGHWRPGNKRKYYGIARASTFEAAAALDLLRIGGVITDGEFDEREEQLAGIGARLTRLCQRYDVAAREE